MCIREENEQREEHYLCEYATKSSQTKGRGEKEEKCLVRTEFQRDRDRITHCKAFRRLMHKTQVFISPEGDHYRTRLTHTLEVAQISRTISRALKLNEDLTEAIALGHDLGHTPFGHTGEDALDWILTDGFRHNEQSIRVVSLIEREGKGLNLTAEVLDGIYNHRSNGVPGTLEGKVVQISDKIAYINHDIDDAVRAGVLKTEELPADCVSLLGYTAGERIDTLIKSVIYNSMEAGDIVMEPEIKKRMDQLRRYMFDTVYLSQLQMKEREKIRHMFQGLYDHYMSNDENLPGEFSRLILCGEELSRVVCDYIACMTDRFAVRLYSNLFMPMSWNI